MSTQHTSEKESSIQEIFEDNFAKTAHLQRYRAVRDSIQLFGKCTERICQQYATFATPAGNQFAVVKPLSDGGLRIGVGLPEDQKSGELDTPVGLGNSSRINAQFELGPNEVLQGKHLGFLMRSREHAE